MASSLEPPWGIEPRPYVYEKPRPFLSLGCAYLAQICADAATRVPQPLSRAAPACPDFRRPRPGPRTSMSCRSTGNRGCYWHRGGRRPQPQDRLLRAGFQRSRVTGGSTSRRPAYMASGNRLEGRLHRTLTTRSCPGAMAPLNHASIKTNCRWFAASGGEGEPTRASLVINRGASTSSPGQQAESGEPGGPPPRRQDLGDELAPGTVGTSRARHKRSGAGRQVRLHQTSVSPSVSRQ